MHWHRLKLPDTVTDTDVFKGVTTMGRLADKNILITGGNSGIGLAAAQEVDREGARVRHLRLERGVAAGG
jgi:NADPH:quinone reductase-like Zn-dependent oxidoreductase